MIKDDTNEGSVAEGKGLKVNKINNLQGSVTSSVTNTPQYTITDPELTIFGKQ